MKNLAELKAYTAGCNLNLYVWMNLCRLPLLSITHVASRFTASDFPSSEGRVWLKRIISSVNQYMQGKSTMSMVTQQRERWTGRKSKTGRGFGVKMQLRHRWRNARKKTTLVSLIRRDSKFQPCFFAWKSKEVFRDEILYLINKISSYSYTFWRIVFTCWSARQLHQFGSHTTGFL